MFGDPMVTLTGIPATDAQGRNTAEVSRIAAVEAFDSLPRAHRRDPDAVAEAIRRAIRASLGAAWNKKPTCHVHVIEV
jgi:ribonuclease J